MNPLPTTAIYLAILPLLAAQGKEPERQAPPPQGISIARDLLGAQRIINDSDGDGWDDLWCDIFRDFRNRSKKADNDADGDKVSDYDEMLLWRDPLVAGPLPEKPNPQDAAAARAAEKAAMAKAEREMPAKLAALGASLRPAFDGKAPDPDSIRPDNARWAAGLAEAIAKARREEPAAQAKLRAIAARHGMATSGKDSRGRDWMLAGEDSTGRPLIVCNQNAQAADAINADDLWPAQAPGVPFFPWQDLSQSRNLTGAGITTAAFDAGNAARETHTEFGGRVIPKRFGGAGTSHPTAVADVIAGGGLLDVFRGGTNHGKMLRGIAYQSTLRSYGLQSFNTDLLGSIQAGAKISNHSYSIVGGWELANIQNQTQWFWRFPQFTQDPRLGNYYRYIDRGFGSGQIDATVLEQKIHLLVIAAGNANAFGPGAAVPYQTYSSPTSNTPVPSTVVRDWSNGDEGGYDSLLPPGTAKNVLTVGSIMDIVGGVVQVSAFSGTGPTDDGRIKPDLVAVGERNPLLGKGNSLFLAHAGSDTAYYNGLAADSDGVIECEGTSYAAPQVTGGLALALQRRAQLFPTAGAALASTWRALAIGTARDIGAPGPDFKCGWGIFDTTGVVRQLESDAAHGRGSLIKEFDIEDQVPKTFYITLPANAAGRATLAWTDVPKGYRSGSPSWVPYLDDYQYPELVNNMGLQIEEMVGDTPTGTRYYPWTLDPSHVAEDPLARSAPAVNTVAGGVVPKDDRNNVERIDIAPQNRARRFRVTVLPESRLWGQIEFGGFYRREPQPVSLVMGGFTPEGPRDGTIAYLDTYFPGPHFTYTFPSDPGAYFTVEVSTTLEPGSWSDYSTIKAEGESTSTTVRGLFADTHRFWRVKRAQ